jgi:hypothetical protein
MNDVQTMVQAIGTLGFPIVAYLLMFFKFQKSFDALAQAVNNNTIAIQKIVDKDLAK